MEQSLFILGRQPALGLAELERLYGGQQVHPVGRLAALVDIAPDMVNFGRLGGAVKLCRPLARYRFKSFHQLQSQLIAEVPQLARLPESGKLTLGFSAYGLPIKAEALFAAGLSLKKQLRQTCLSVRLVPLTEGVALSSAQVIHNNLAKAGGLELVCVADGANVWLAQTVAEQDIAAYTHRDRERPKRDSRVGMLPPKLAQIIVNLAVGDADPKFGGVVLDPFCGTGVVLQEAALMGFDIAGSDLEPRMVEYSQQNLQWLLGQPGTNIRPLGADDSFCQLQTADATSHTWQPAPNFVACESYLGRPFTSRPDAAIINKTVAECDVIISKFLRNIHKQLPPKAGLCVAVPAWQTAPDRFRYLPLVDQMSQLGYTRIRFEHVSDASLLYYREDQIVARQLLVLERT